MIVAADEEAPNDKNEEHLNSEMESKNPSSGKESDRN
jgi:hypothetical protein